MITSMGLKPSQDVVKCLKEAVEERLPGYEKILAKQKFLAGDELTLVDLFHLAHGTLLVEVSHVRRRPGLYPLLPPFSLPLPRDSADR